VIKLIPIASVVVKSSCDELCFLVWKCADSHDYAEHVSTSRICPWSVETTTATLDLGYGNKSLLLRAGEELVVFHRTRWILSTVRETHAEDINIGLLLVSTVGVNNEIGRGKKAIEPEIPVGQVSQS